MPAPSAPRCRAAPAGDHRVALARAGASGGGERVARALRRDSGAVIARYVAGGEPFDKAGAYAIQSSIAAWISRIEGSYSGIMGLPLCETAPTAPDDAGVRF